MVIELETAEQSGTSPNMSSLEDHFCVQWKDYQWNLSSMFYQLLQTEAFVDVTIICNDNSLKAHKVVLSANSSYFQKILLDNPCKHPTIILPQEVEFNDLKFIIDFVYRGEIEISKSELQSLLKTADQLKIKGLCEFLQGWENEINSNGKSVTDVGLLDSQMLPNKSRQKLVSRFPCGRFQSAIKRRAPTSAQEMGSSRKCCAKKNKPVEQTGVQLIEATTISANDVLDSNDHQQYHNLQPANCITVATSTDEDEYKIESNPSNLPAVVILDNSQQLGVSSSMHYLQANHTTSQHCVPTDEKIILSNTPPVMNSTSTTLTTLQPQPQLMLEQDHHQPQLIPSTSGTEDVKSRDVEIMSETQPLGPTATPVHCHSMELHHSTTHRDIAVHASGMSTGDIKVKFETLRTMDQASDSMDTRENQMSEHNMNDDDHTMHTMMITPELLSFVPSTSSTTPSEVGSENGKGMASSKKDWTQEDMDAALDALRNHHMSLTKASITFGIPSTTLWQRAHRLGIDTPKKDGPSKLWNEEVLNVALDALRTGSLSANKASKAYGIPSSTLYKIARREGIRLAAPFNAAPTTWTQDDLERALEAIRTGQTTVQKAATEYGIPTGTLYGRCKREKIELSRNNPTPWSQDAMSEALEAIRLGHMSINQASIHYNLPYSSLYGRFRKGKHEAEHLDQDDESINVDVSTPGGRHHPSLMQHNAEMQPNQQHQAVQVSQQQSTIQPQLMLLQYQPAQTTHIQMYQPAAPS